MAHATQFHEVYRERVAALRGRRDPAGRRWRIWAQQAEQGALPCFATETRNTCQETACPWRDECLALKAEWKR